MRARSDEAQRRCHACGCGECGKRWGPEIAAPTQRRTGRHRNVGAAKRPAAQVRIRGAVSRRHGALPQGAPGAGGGRPAELPLSLIHISEPTRLGMISYAVFCLKKKKKTK